MIVDKYGNYVRKFMWQRRGWGRVDIYMTFHKRAFDFFYTIAYWFDNFQNCATMNCKCQLYPTHTVATIILNHPILQWVPFNCDILRSDWFVPFIRIYI
jgi:hypothetical protein